MLHLYRRVVVCTLILGLAAGLLAASAWADSIGGGELYGVYANGGSFSSAESYTVIHHASFDANQVDASGQIPPLIPNAFPSAFDTVPGGTGAVVPGGEYFLIGFLSGADDNGDHFVVSAPFGSSGGESSPLSEHSALVAGAAAVGNSLEAPIDELSWSEFWGAFNESYELTDTQFANYFMDLNVGDNQGPVGTLHGESLSFDGSENLFGYTGDGQLVATIGGLLNDVTITSGGVAYSAVPEPASFALVLGGLAVVGAARRRRRSA